MKNYIKMFFLLIVLFYSKWTTAQVDSLNTSKNGSFSLYVNSPLGLINKVRIKVEYRNGNNHAILFCITKYHGVNPGLQTYLEYRKYFVGETKPENFFYGKSGAGYSSTYNGQYALIGLGLGQYYSFGKTKSFSIQFTEGLKYCYTLKGDIDSEMGSGFRGAFYLFGPGAIIDLNINLGWRF